MEVSVNMFLEKVSSESTAKVFIFFSFIGSFLFFVGSAIFLIVEFLRVRNGSESEVNPWGGHTLEWTEEVVTVSSERPLLDIEEKVGVDDV